MITYDKLWALLKKRGISQSKLYRDYGISRAQVYRLKHNQIVYTSTLDMLCQILDCSDISDIATYISEKSTADEDGGTE